MCWMCSIGFHSNRRSRTESFFWWSLLGLTCSYLHDLCCTTLSVVTFSALLNIVSFAQAATKQNRILNIFIGLIKMAIWENPWSNTKDCWYSNCLAYYYFAFVRSYGFKQAHWL